MPGEVGPLPGETRGLAARRARPLPHTDVRLMPPDARHHAANNSSRQRGSMIGSILKVLAYRQAPKTTFAMLHPDAAFQMAKMRYDFHHAYAPRVAAIAAAAVALPLGIILGRAIERGARRGRGERTAASRSTSRRTVITTGSRHSSASRIRPGDTTPDTTARSMG